MPITFIGANTGGGSAGSVTFAALLDDLTGDGRIMIDDFLVLVIEGEGEDVSDDGVPTGWTTVDSIASSTAGGVDDTRCTVAWARYSSSLSVVVPDAGDHTIARIYVFRGVEAGANVEAFTSGATVGPNTSHTVVTGLTTLTDGAMVVLGLAVGDDVTITSVANASLASCSDGGGFLNISGSGGTVDALYGIKTTAGGAGSFTFTTDTSESIAWVALSLKPADHTPQVYGALTEVISEVIVNPRVYGGLAEVVTANARIPNVYGAFIEVISAQGVQLDFIDEDEMFEPTVSTVALEDNVYLREGADAEPHYYELEDSSGFLALESAPDEPNLINLDFIDEDEMFEPVVSRGPATAVTLDFIDEDAIYEPTATLSTGATLTLGFIDEDEFYEITVALGTSLITTLDFIDEDEMFEFDFRTPSVPPPVPREPGAQRFPASGGSDDTKRRGMRPVSGGTTVRGPRGR